ncbi:MAG: SDR family NAD(P)-dependent oxidoreductase, partial [Xanthobacteraceae bacterium]
MNKNVNPPQQQDRQPGRESEMRPLPDYEPKTRGSGRLKNKVVLITGGDSGIGRAVAVAMAREGASIAFGFLNEKKDAAETVKLIEAEKREAVSLAGDIGYEKYCKKLVGAAVKKFGRIDVLVNNAAEQHEVDTPGELTEEQI